MAGVRCERGPGGCLDHSSSLLFRNIHSSSPGRRADGKKDIVRAGGDTFTPSGDPRKEEKRNKKYSYGGLISDTKVR